MAQTVAGMLRKFQALDLVEELGEAIQQTAPEAIALQKKQLYERGEKADGTKLSKYKSDAYARLKNKMNPNLPYGQADGKKTGEMYDEMYLDVRETTAVFDSASPHATFMIERDGPAVFGLQDESKAEHGKIVAPVVVQRIRNKTGCK